MSMVVRTLGFKSFSRWTSFQYLGVPIFLKKRKFCDRDGVIQNIKRLVYSWGIKWLNLVGKIMLVKAIISSLPIFIYSSLLPHVGVMSSLNKEIRMLLQHGGKDSQNKFHILNWEIVRTEKIRGVVGHEPRLMNIELGTKMLCRIVTGKEEWWKEIIHKKYIKNPSLRCLYLDLVGQG